MWKNNLFFWILLTEENISLILCMFNFIEWRNQIVDIPSTQELLGKVILSFDECPHPHVMILYWL